jgi:hypothetical protein
MATMCPYKSRHCVDCPHCRYDEDYGEKACWLAYDQEQENRMREILGIKETENKEE